MHSKPLERGALLTLAWQSTRSYGSRMCHICRTTDLFPQSAPPPHSGRIPRRIVRPQRWKGQL